MRSLRYLINASLVLSLSFAGLCASKAETNSNQWIDLDLLDHANKAYRTSPHSVLGYGYDTTKQTLSDHRILQADQEPMSVNLCDEPNSGFACKTKVFKTSGSRWLANLFGVTYTSRGHTVMQFYSQNSTEMMHYPAGTQLSIIPDTTSNITQLEGFIKFRRSEVVISVSLGYLAALEVKIDFGSAEAFKAFQAARSPKS